MVINIINNVLIKILFLFLALWILLFVDNTVQLKNKIIHTEGNLCLFSKTLRLNLLDQLENPVLDRIKRDQVIVKIYFSSPEHSASDIRKRKKLPSAGCNIPH